MSSDEYFNTDEFRTASVVKRTIHDAYFPGSPRANTRESIFSNVLVSILESKPGANDISELFTQLEQNSQIDISPDLLSQVREVFKQTYVKTGQNDGNEYLVPFHPKIPKNISPDEATGWGDWYRLLMTTDEGFNSTLHDALRDHLESLPSSNIFEEAFVRAAENIDSGTKYLATDPIKPYVLACSLNFQQDLKSWLQADHLSTSEWMKSFRDLFYFHMMMYLLQISINLRHEFEHLSSNPGSAYEPTIRGIYFGLTEETAGQGRKFRKEWERRSEITGNGEGGIEDDIYHSWGRLVVMRIISKAIEENNGESHEIYTPTELSATNKSEIKETVIDLMVERLNDDRLPEQKSFDQMCLTFSQTVSEYYNSKSKKNRTPTWSGIGSISQLAKGDERKYMQNQTNVGTTFRLNRGALRFFGQLFELASGSNHYQEFIQYLSERGVSFDSQSKNKCESILDEMGMITKKSDSGEAIYVESI